MPPAPRFVRRAIDPILAILASASAAGAVCSPPVQARLDFIESRVEERRDYAANWWRVWTAGYGAGVVFQSVRAGLEDDSGKRADFIVGAVKAAYGTTRLLQDPPNAGLGADPMREVATVDEASCLRRLAIGEELLRKNAKEAKRRHSWKRHLLNFAVNLGGTLIVTEIFDENDGWMSGGIGIAVGELQLWTHPSKADEDLEEYEARFSSATASRPTWNLSAYVAQGAGVRLEVRF